MKKILSVMLAIMMLFGALSISASAADLTYEDYVNTLTGDGSDVVIVFEFYGGSAKKALPVYTPDGKETFTLTKDVTGTYYMIPGAGGKDLKAGTVIEMPSVKAPEDKDFTGWTCSVRDFDLTPGSPFIIGKEDIAKAHTNDYGVIYMTANYETAEPEEDTMATVLGVLTKVFGTILGILFLDGSSEAGIALVEKLLGGLL